MLGLARFPATDPARRIISVARDMDAVRELLGEEKLSLLGWSYGGVPAAAYARLYPQRIRAMVLDGTPDQTAGPFVLNRGGQIRRGLGKPRIGAQLLLVRLPLGPRRQLGDHQHTQ